MLIAKKHSIHLFLLKNKHSMNGKIEAKHKVIVIFVFSFVNYNQQWNFQYHLIIITLGKLSKQY